MSKWLCINILSASELKGGITVNVLIVLIISESLSLASEKYYNTRRKKHIMILLLIVGCVSVAYNCDDVTLESFILMFRCYLNDDTFKR